METTTFSFSTTNYGFHDPLGFAARRCRRRKALPLAHLGFAGVQNRRRRSRHLGLGGGQSSPIIGPLAQLGFAEKQNRKNGHPIWIVFACAHGRRGKSGSPAQFGLAEKCDRGGGPLLQLGLADRRNCHPFLPEKSNNRNGLLRYADTHSRQNWLPPKLQFLGPLGFAGGCKKRSSTPLVLLGFFGGCSRDNRPLLAVGGYACTAGERMESDRTSWSIRPHQWLRLSSRIMSTACRGRSGDFAADEFGPYPWDPSWHISDSNAIEWIQEDIITLFTSDGLIQIGGSLIPHQLSPMERKQSPGKAPIRYRRFRAEDYMDPKQGLCLGALFNIVATNGLDMGRRFCVFGFCRSIEMLSDVVEDTVLEQGGEVVLATKGSFGGLNEKLSMTVAVPLLWGVPPAVDSLNYAIRCGGGIVEKASCQWEFL